MEICIDIMFINEQPFLTTIDGQVKFQALVPLSSRVQKEIFRGIDMIFRHYNKAGFMIKYIYCDGEFWHMMDQMNNELDVNMNYANPDEHVPEV